MAVAINMRIIVIVAKMMVGGVTATTVLAFKAFDKIFHTATITTTTSATTIIIINIIVIINNITIITVWVSADVLRCFLHTRTTTTTTTSATVVNCC
eukprot:CAMPEP_0175011096 /NCGR_PEP_ID=MMETSP0005-20121125/8461_1 /TAXON_ID=420556 /ORGANISM="Ochromonas sp., Strain CCMP1393" /LENGTH=96 /DNA_ID=CAMNT_0016266979 /DNA_START=368 /DNA_END=655 /DNA_ORIENTATION=+